MIKYPESRITPPKRILTATGSLIPSNEDEIIEMSSAATANVRVDYSIGVLYAGRVKEFKNNSTQYFFRINFNSQITLDGVLNPGVTSVPPGGVFRIVTTESSTVTNDYTSLGFSSFRVLPVVPVATTTDTVDTAFLNTNYPIENYPIGTVVAYYNTNIEYRRVTANIWNQRTTGTVGKNANGGLKFVSASAQILLADYGANGECTVFLDATAGPFILTLPTASNALGLTTYVVKTDASANTPTIKGNGSELINNANTDTSLSTQNASFILKSNGTKHFKF